VEGDNASWGIYEQIGRLTQNRIQFENMADMLTGKDLVLIDFPADEAEFVLHLFWLITSCEKMVNYTDAVRDADYWARRGVCVRAGGGGAYRPTCTPSQGPVFRVGWLYSFDADNRRYEG
jgi:hypothetical protein